MTIAEATVEKVYSIVALAINQKGAVIYPIIDHRVWAVWDNDKWQSTDLEVCIVEQGLGFIWEDDTFKISSACFNTNECVSHFEVHPEETVKEGIVVD